MKGACQFCNSGCGLDVHVKDGRVIDIQGETNDPVQAGGVCVKGPMMAQLVYNRHRLTRPMKRVSGEKGSADALGLPRHETTDHLLDDRCFDNLSGQQAYKGFACRVTRA